MQGWVDGKTRLDRKKMTMEWEINKSWRRKAVSCYKRQWRIQKVVDHWNGRVWIDCFICGRIRSTYFKKDNRHTRSCLGWNNCNFCYWLVLIFNKLESTFYWVIYKSFIFVCNTVHPMGNAFLLNLFLRSQTFK